MADAGRRLKSRLAGPRATKPAAAGWVSAASQATQAAFAAP